MGIQLCVLGLILYGVVHMHILVKHHALKEGNIVRHSSATSYHHMKHVFSMIFMQSLTSIGFHSNSFITPAYQIILFLFLVPE